MRSVIGTLIAAALLAAAGPSWADRCGWRPGELLTLEGTVRSGGLDGRLVRRVELGTGRLYERSDLVVVASARGFDGRLAWSQDVSGATHDLDSTFARALATSEAWLDARQGCRPQPGPGAVRLAPTTLGARGLEAWRITPRGGAPFEAWYDAETGRLDHAEFQTAETRLVRRFDDWREVKPGRWVAMAQRDEFPEDEDETLYRITAAHVAPRAAPADFHRPPPPHDVHMRAGRRETTVAFADDHRTRVYVPVFLDGKGPFTFELDNGGHFIVSDETAKAVGLSAQGSFNGTGAGSAVTQSGFARIASLRIGDAEMLNQPARVRALPAAANDRGRDPPRAGILGLELFERFVVRIDQRSRTVSLRPLGAPRPRLRGTPLRLVFTEDAPLTAGAYRGVAGDFMLDTGNAGATIVEDYWASAHRLTDDLKRGPSFPGVTLSSGDVEIGPFKLTGEAVSYFGPAERGSEYTRAVAGVYGQPLLSRFNATYDYRRKTVWLEPLPGMAAVPANRSGLLLMRKRAAEPLTITAVAEGSPAAGAPLKPGDQVLAIAGQATGELSRADAQAMLLQPPGTVVELTIGGAEGPRTVRLTLRDLTPRR